MTRILVILLVAVLAQATAAETIHALQDQPTIQAGIDAASGGGTYDRHPDPIRNVPDGTRNDMGALYFTCCNVPGDVNHDRAVDLLDFQYLRDYLHKEGPEPVCLEEADVNGDGEITKEDMSCMVRYLYSKGNPCEFVECPSHEPTLHVSLSEWQPFCLGDTADPILVENVGDLSSIDWTADADEDWLVLSTSSGSTPSTFTISVDTNWTSAARKGTVTVSSPGVDGSPWPIAVEQKAIVAQAGLFGVPSWCNDVFVSGDYAYIAAVNAGLMIVDVSDRTNPNLAGQYEIYGNAEDVFVAGDYAYVIDRIAGLIIVDVSDPTQPSLAGSSAEPLTGVGIFVQGDYAYVADQMRGLSTYDVSDVSAPYLLASVPSVDYSFDVYVVGDYAYLADHPGGLRVIDVSDPANPSVVGEYSASNTGADIWVQGDYAYMVSGNYGLQVLDITDPTNPTLTGSLDTDGFTIGVHVMGDFAYLSEMSSGLAIIDISDPVNPIQLMRYSTADGIYAAFVLDGHACLAEDAYLETVDLGL